MSSPLVVLAYPPQAADGSLPAAQLVGQFASHSAAIYFVHEQLGAGDRREFSVYQQFGRTWHGTRRPVFELPAERAA